MMKMNLVRSLFLVVPFLSAVPAHASTLFGGSGGFTNTLTITTAGGSLVFQTNQGAFSGSVNNQGWWSAADGHSVGNDNYYVSNEVGSEYNNYFTFLLTGFDGGALSATLSIDTSESSGSDLPTIYSLFDVSTAAASLNDSGPDSAIFDDLSSGKLYAALIVSSYPSPTMSLTLNADALGDINAAGGGYFSIGGTLAPSESATPEPGTISLLAAGLLAVVMARASRRRMGMWKVPTGGCERGV
ncbi:MAG: PEP-CTERM sorting domain-containing protein [Acidobacteriota bacterium]